jgi:hypothetical protein
MLIYEVTPFQYLEAADNPVTNLIFIYPCIANIIPNYNQQDARLLDLFISTDNVHVSGGSSAHHQEHIQLKVFSINTVSYCYRG